MKVQNRSVTAACISYDCSAYGALFVYKVAMIGKSISLYIASSKSSRAEAWVLRRGRPVENLPKALAR